MANIINSGGHPGNDSKSDCFSQIGETNLANTQLVFDGWNVLLGETPESMGMEDGDMVEVANFGYNRRHRIKNLLILNCEKKKKFILVIIS